MGFLTQKELNSMGFKHLGKNVQISDKASIYNCEQIQIGDYSRIDDFCVLSGKIKIGRNVHIASQCRLNGGSKGLIFEDFSCLAYHCQVLASSDDYSGETMTNPTIPSQYKREIMKETIIKKHSIVGAGSIILAGANLAEGTSIGAMSLVRKPTQEWSIYVGNPVKKIKNRKKNILSLENEYLNSKHNRIEENK